MLDPERHGEAAAAFLGHFSLHAGGAVREFLARLMDRYTTIPYENLSKIMKRAAARSEEERLRLPGEVLHDHLERGLGGTCFSLSFSLLCILRHAGLSSYLCMAHMGKRKNVHCVTVVETAEGKYLLDPGYVISAPVPMRHEMPVHLRVPHTCVALVYDPARGSFDLFSGRQDGLKWRYRFRDVPVSPEEFLVYWQESFVMGTMDAICLSLRKGDTLVYLHGDYCRENRIDGFSTTRLRDDLAGSIQRITGLDGGVVEEAASILGARQAQRRPACGP